ncbi:MAG TPA: phosphoribosylamine--glycine ligase [Gaiellaceae bacterium]|nr:phosphoribosylamine--glycine ligase [Gaiellaceae bacterium]
MKVLLVGSGGREHALAWKLAQSPGLTELHAAPGNPGIAQLGTCHPIRAEDGEGLLDLAHMLRADLVVVGPEAPLVAGLGDKLRHFGLAVFGPSAAAARIEGSKTFAKEVMRAAGVATAETMSVARPPCVVKADGLAAGKGVFVCRTQEELDAALRAVSAFGDQWMIEELLEGEELSVFALAAGTQVVGLAAARDYKRAGDGDTGPNTGGMGAYSPVPDVSASDVEELVETVHRPVLEELAARGAPFIGLLYAGLMLGDGGARVLEFNCRFGDPETQVVLPRLEGDVLGALAASARGDLSEVDLRTSDSAAVTVALVAERYPEAGDVGSPIEGVDEAEADGAIVFHAGTAARDGRLVTNGGRILNVTALGENVEEARVRAYAACAQISFPGKRYRTDVGERTANVAG